MTNKKYFMDFDEFYESEVEEQSKESVNEQEAPREEGNYAQFIPDRGKLKVKLTREGQEELQDRLQTMQEDPDTALSMIFEDITTNSEYEFVPNLGEAGFGLTDKPGIAWGYIAGPDGQLDKESEDAVIYVFGQAQHPVDALLNEGEAEAQIVR